MKLGFSSLSLFPKSIEEIINKGKINDFQIIELLVEGPYNGKNLLNNKKDLEALRKTDLEILIHGPSVDLNLASLNKGIRKESIRQIKETVDLASTIKSKIITIHPGLVGRKEKIIRNMAIENSISSIKELVSYGKEKDVKISIENMPYRFNFLGNSVEEIELLSDETSANITIDLGHANTCLNPEEFLNLNNISYFHLNDNNGKKDQHLPLGEGTLDLNLLKKVNKGIIELNNFENVLKSKKIIKSLY